MLLLRQVVSVIPMVLACLVMVFTQTKFRSYTASIASFVFLLCVPAVVENNMWWHPDSITVLFIALTFFFLDQDQLSFRKNFYFAAVACGLATGTKVMGLFFFLAIPMYILMGIWQKKLTWTRAIISAVGFVALMVATIVISNPFLLLPNLFNEMLRIQSGQAQAMSSGWTLLYAKGPASWLPIIQELYAPPWFFAFVILILIFGIVRDRNRILNMMILAWIVPLSGYILFFVAIKPTHFFLPIVIPLFSCISIIFESLPEFKLGKLKLKQRQSNWKVMVPGLAILLALGYQTIVFIDHDIKTYNEVLTREQQNPELNFYATLDDKYLKGFPAGEPLVVYRDVRIYFPEGGKRRILSFFNTITYADIEKKKPDLIILRRQRIWDYTREGAAQDAIDPEEFQEVYRFFADAKNDSLNGYRLIYEDETGLAFASNELYEKYFRP
jgi:hypothetical protein